MMDLDLVLEVLKDVARWTIPLTEIIPVNYGEFFMHSDWERILSLIATILPQTNIVIPTNGALLRANQAKTICSIPQVKIINFSVNAYFDETYEAFMGLPKENLTHIENLCKLIKTWRPDLSIRISMVFDPAYQTDLERDLVIQHWKQFGNVFILPAASADRKEQQVEIIRKQPCRSIFSDIVVLADKRLTSCCFDSEAKIDCGEYDGDLHKNWHNEKLEGLRKLHNAHQREKVELCKRCSFA